VRTKTLISDSIAILLSLAVIFMMAKTHPMDGGSFLQVQAEDGTYRYPLSEDRTLTVDGPLGKTTISIKDGKASIVDSPCENKTCIHMAPIGSDGGFAACLPNGVLLTVGAPPAQEAIDDVAN